MNGVNRVLVVKPFAVGGRRWVRCELRDETRIVREAVDES
jgi:hypothetical protein